VLGLLHSLLCCIAFVACPVQGLGLVAYFVHTVGLLPVCCTQRMAYSMLTSICILWCFVSCHDVHRQVCRLSNWLPKQQKLTSLSTSHMCTHVTTASKTNIMSNAVLFNQVQRNVHWTLGLIYTSLQDAVLAVIAQSLDAVVSKHSVQDDTYLLMGFCA